MGQSDNRYRKAGAQIGFCTAAVSNCEIVMGRSRCHLLIAALLYVCTPASAQDSFYKGKTVTFLVGAPPGGGFDTMTRIVARHFGRHLPGNPIVVVQNMTGAGTLIAANHLYNRSKPDGLTNRGGTGGNRCRIQKHSRADHGETGRAAIAEEVSELPASREIKP